MIKFEKPVVEIEMFEISDVITTSFDCPRYEPCDWELPS
jgi:hypothetical protein